MQKKIQSFFLKRKNKQASLHSSVTREMVAYADAKNIGLLFLNTGEDYQAINGFVKKLTTAGKQVKALTYFEQMQSTGYDFTFDYFTRDQVSPTGNMTSEKVSRFIENRFDYLFCIHTHSFLPFDYILLQSKARYRIGMYLEEKPKCFELMIRPLPEHTLSQVLDQLLHYTQALTLHGK